MSSFCTTASPLFTKLTTAQAEFTHAYTQLTQHPENQDLLTQAQTCRATLEQALDVCETSFPGHQMRKILKDRGQEFVPGVEVTLVPPEKDLIVDITSEELNLVYELLGGKEAWERAIRPKAADFKRMCQWTDPATGKTHDWHTNSPYAKMFFPKRQQDFDTSQGLVAELDTLTVVPKALRAMYLEMKEQEARYPKAFYLIDTALKPETCDNFASANDEELARKQSYANDSLLNHLQTLVSADMELTQLLQHRFNKSYVRWTEEILP